jgi:hypothetical protein
MALSRAGSQSGSRGLNTRGNPRDVERDHALDQLLQRRAGERKAKFTDCATLQLKPAVAARVLELVRNVDRLASLREIGAAMHPTG